MWVWGHFQAPELMTVIVAIGPPPGSLFRSSFSLHLVLQAYWQNAELLASPGQSFFARQSHCDSGQLPFHALINHSTHPAPMGLQPASPTQSYPKKDAFTFTYRKKQVRSSDWSRCPSVKTKSSEQNSKMGPKSPIPGEHIVPGTVDMIDSTPVTSTCYRAQLALQRDSPGDIIM